MLNQNPNPGREPNGGWRSGDRPWGRLSLRTAFPAFMVLAVTSMAGCGPKQMESDDQLSFNGGKIGVVVEAIPDTVMTAISRVLLQEGIALRRYDSDDGTAESGFIDLSSYREFDNELWDNTERLIKLRFQVAREDSLTALVVEPLYNPYEVVTHEIDYTRLRLVPPGHPGFAVAAGLTRRIAAHAEGRVVSSP